MLTQNTPEYGQKHGIHKLSMLFISNVNLMALIGTYRGGLGLVGCSLWVGSGGAIEGEGVG
jgi:hypothetical protein